MLDYINILIKYGPNVINDIISAHYASKNVIGNCICCGKEVFSDKIGLFTIGAGGLIITCDSDICKNFTLIKTLGEKNGF